MQVLDKMTWSNNEVSSRIDKFYISENFPFKFNYTSINQTFKSDHKAVIADLEFKNNFKKEKYYNPWKLNDSILDNEEVIKGVKEISLTIKDFKVKHGKL